MLRNYFPYFNSFGIVFPYIYLVFIESRNIFRCVIVIATRIL